MMPTVMPTAPAICRREYLRRQMARGNSNFSNRTDGISTRAGSFDVLGNDALDPKHERAHDDGERDGRLHEQQRLRRVRASAS